MKCVHVALLALATALVIGYGWSIDMPQAIQVPLRQPPYNYTTFQFNMLYFFTYLPILIFNIPIGIVLDKLPIQKTLTFLVFLTFMSSLLTVYLFQFRFAGYLIIVYILRAVFGAAGEGLFTVQALIISNYGKKYYETLMGFSLCIPFIFDAMNCIFTPIIYDATESITLVWYIGALFSFISLVCGIFIACILRSEVKIQKQQKLVVKQKQRQERKSIQNDIQREKSTIPNNEQINQTNSIKLDKKQVKDQINPDNQESDQQEQEFNFDGVKKMSKFFWILMGVIFFTEYCVGSFIDNLNDTLVKRFQIPYVTAGEILIIPYGLASILSIILGKMLNLKPKWRRKSFFLASLLYFLGLAGLYFLPNIQKGDTASSFHYVVIAFFCITMSFLFAELYSCLCSCIVYVVEKKYIGTAWGIVGSTLGFSQCIGPISNSLMISSADNLSDAYTNLTLYTTCLSFITLSLSIWLLMGDFSVFDTNYQTNKNKKQITNESKKQPQNQQSDESLRNSLLSQDNFDSKQKKQIILS